MGWGGCKTGCLCLVMLSWECDDLGLSDGREPSELHTFWMIDYID